MNIRSNKNGFPKLPENMAHLVAQFAIWTIIVLLFAIVADKQGTFKF